MRPLILAVASLLPLLALLMVMVEAGRAGESKPARISPRPEVAPVELPADPAIRCPLDRRDAPLKKEGEIGSLAFSPDGKTLAAGNARGFVKLFDPDTGRSLRSFQPGGGSAAIAYSPDGQGLAATSSLSVMAIFDPISGGLSRKMDPTDDAGIPGLRCSVFSPDDRTLAAGFANGNVALWDAATGRLLHVLPPYTIPAHTNGPFKNPVAAQNAPIGSLSFSPDGRTLYGGGHVVRVWDVASGREQPRPEQPEHSAFYSVAISADGKTLAGGSPYQPYDPETSSRALVGPERSITIWDVATGRRLSQLPTTEPIVGLAFLPGSKALVSLDYQNVLRLWDLASGHSAAAVRFEHHFQCHVLAVSPDGRRIAAGGYESDPIFGAIVLVDTDGVKLGSWKPKP